MPDGAEFWINVGVVVVNAVIAVVSVVLNWRMLRETRASTGLLVNEEFRKAFRELTEQEPGPAIERVLASFEEVDNDEVRESLRRLRQLQRQSPLYRTKSRSGLVSRIRNFIGIKGKEGRG
jgi:hypothetical protein